MYHDTRSVYSDIHLPEKNNLNTPRPITDDGIRRTLKKHVKLKKLKVPPKDQKILKLMVDKGTWEKDYWKGRLERSLVWDTQKSDHDHIKLEQFKNHRMQMEINREEDRQKVMTEKLERQKKRLEKKTQQLKKLEKDSQEHDKNIEEQHKIKEEKIKKLIEKENELKTQQEKNWWEVNSKEYEKKLTEKIAHDKDRLIAAEKREEHIKDEVQRIVKENEHERLYFTERYICLEKKQKKNKKSLTVKIERKTKKASENFEAVQNERIKAIEKDVKMEEEKLEKALKTQFKMEQEQQDRARKMVEKKQEDIEKANALLEKSLKDMTTDILVERESKEKAQQKNIKKIRKEIEKWKKKTAKQIKKEERKSKEKQEERQRVLERSRSVAQGSRMLRDKVMYAFGAEDFNRKVFRVERFRDLGSRSTLNDLHTATINMLLV